VRASQAKELFRDLLQSYFTGANVTFTRQSRIAKPALPLVTITPGNVRRPLNPVYQNVEGEVAAYYQSRISMQIDLFTHGLPVYDIETGKAVAYENTAMDDMLALADFLNSEYTIEWCHRNDVSILIDGDATDLTGIVNDNNYEYRSRLTVQFYFTQKAVGYAAILTENSIQDLGGEDTDSTTGSSGVNYYDDAVITPNFEHTSSGGGSEELANQSTGYFTEAEAKEEKAYE
jgi:hypothetical protein